MGSEFGIETVVLLGAILFGIAVIIAILAAIARR